GTRTQFVCECSRSTLLLLLLSTRSARAARALRTRSARAFLRPPLSFGTPPITTLGVLGAARLAARVSRRAVRVSTTRALRHPLGGVPDDAQRTRSACAPLYALEEPDV